MEHVRSRRSPKCARCRNHGFSVPLRGHAGRCRFARCVCWKCALITERTRITARQREAGAAGSGVTEPDGEEDKTYTELQQNPETAGLREQPRVPWECFMPHTPLSAVHLGDLPLAMPFPLHGHYGDALRFGPVTFPHVPPAALVEHRQEAPCFFYVPYLPHPHPDLHPPAVWEPDDGVLVSPLRDGPDSGSRWRSSTPPGGALQSTQE